MWFSTVIEFDNRPIVYRVYATEGRAYFSPSQDYLKQAPTFRAYKESGSWQIRDHIAEELVTQVRNLTELD